MADGTPDLSSVISKIMSDPEMMKTVMGLGEKLNGGADKPDGEKPEPAKPAGGPDPRIALLAAMKPFLSPERQTMVDNIVKFSKFGDMLGGITGIRL